MPAPITVIKSNVGRQPVISINGSGLNGGLAPNNVNVKAIRTVGARAGIGLK